MDVSQPLSQLSSSETSRAAPKENLFQEANSHIQLFTRHCSFKQFVYDMLRQYVTVVIRYCGIPGPFAIQERSVTDYTQPWLVLTAPNINEIKTLKELSFSRSNSG